MNKLTEGQKNEIRMSLLEKIKDDDMRSKIMTIAFSYSDETGEADDLEKMVYFLMENPSRVDDLYREFVGSMSFDATEGKEPKKKD